MKRRLFLASCGLLVIVGMSTLAQPARSVDSFNKEFKALYLRTGSTTASTQATVFASSVQRAGCSVCHLTKKKGFNAYGKQVATLLTASDKTNRTKIRAALTKVAAMPTKANDAKSPTFGDRIRQGKLPGSID
jgi:hypothetical protein